MASSEHSQSALTIIIPVLNEERSLVTSLDRFKAMSDAHELIFVDGGSSDDTANILKANNFRVISSQQKGRGLQFALGVEHSSTDSKLILLLHIDTILPNNWYQSISQEMKNSQWGFFRIRLNSTRPVFRIIEKLMIIRSTLSNIATGDQTIFVKKDIFMTCIDRVKAHPIMEDIFLSSYLKKNYGRACIIHDRVTTSTRYWEKNGIIKSIIKMWRFRLLYFFGMSPDDLYRLYYS